MNMKHGGRVALAAAGWALVASVAHAGTPQLLSEREMSGVYGQGLSGAAIDALTGNGGGDRHSNAGLDALAAASMPFLSLAALSGDASRGFDRQLTEQEAIAASNGLQNTINLSRLVVDASKFQAPLAAVTLPSLNLGLLFGLAPMLPTLPTLPNGGNNNNNNGQGPGH